jgi:hypothetical protein
MLSIKDLAGLQDAARDVPRQLEELLDRSQMAGPLSLEAIVNAVQNSPMISEMARDMVAMRRMSTY